MRTNLWLAASLTLLSMSLAAPAWAQEGGETPTPPPDETATTPVAASPRMAAGVRIELLVSNDYSYDKGGYHGSADGTFGAGFGFMFEYRVWDYVKVGADMVLATVKPEHVPDRDTLFNLGARGTGFYPIKNLGPIQVLSPYGFITMGYAGYFSGNKGGDDEQGFWIEGGAGAEASFGVFSVFAELAGQGNLNSDYTFSAFQLTFGGKYLF